MKLIFYTYRANMKYMIHLRGNAYSIRVMSELERTRSNNAGQTVMVPRETGLATTEFAKFQTLCRARLAY